MSSEKYYSANSQNNFEDSEIFNLLKLAILDLNFCYKCNASGVNAIGASQGGTCNSLGILGMHSWAKGVFEAEFRFRGGQGTAAGGVGRLCFSSFLLVIIKFSFWKGGMGATL